MRTSALRVVDLITTNEDKKFEPAGRMASVIITLVQKQGHCEPHDLNAEGFTPSDVQAHWHLAHALASAELKLMGRK